MEFMDAIKQAEAGHSIYRPCWTGYVVIWSETLFKSGKSYFLRKDQNGGYMPWVPLFQDIKGTDWEVKTAS